MGAVVVFEPEQFRAEYPKFTEALVSDAQLFGFFKTACEYIDNTEESTIPYAPDKGVFTRERMLYLAVCHLASLSLWPMGAAGPMSNASEGSVSVGYSNMSWTNGQFWNQTPCGQALWAMVQKLLAGGRYYAARTFHPWG